MIKNDEELAPILIDIQEAIVLEDTPENWKNAKFSKQRILQIDKRGSVGERFFAQVLFKLFPRRIAYKDGDQGDWDLKINKIKFEIKTSTLDRNNKFQNEGLKKKGDYDGILFLGIAPNDLYIKIVRKTDINFDELELHSDTGITKLHNRGKDDSSKTATGAGYKCDFKVSEMKKVTTLKDVEQEFNKHFKF